MKRLSWMKVLAPLIAVAMLMATFGNALAYQFSRQYDPNSVYGAANGRAWSPSYGTYAADASGAPGSRTTNPLGYNVVWYSPALSYIRSNGQNVAITFHSYNGSNGCSSFQTNGYAATNLPAPVYYQYIRQCWSNQKYTEGRVTSTNANLMGAGVSYWGQAVYTEYTTTSAMQKFTVDTYYGGNQNYHQVYCIYPGQSTAVTC